AQRCQGLEQAAVEAGNGLASQWPRYARTFAGADVQLVLLKIELNFEDARRVRHRSRRQPTAVDVQRDMPPMIHRRGEGHADLANNLRPHVKGGVGGLPFVLPQRRATRSLA